MKRKDCHNLATFSDEELCSILHGLQVAIALAKKDLDRFMRKWDRVSHVLLDRMQRCREDNHGKE